MSAISSPSRSSYARLPNCSHAKDLLKGSLPTCAKCHSQRLSHYCIQKQCHNKQLVCVSCDVDNLSGPHFSHRFSYILPLLIQPVSKNLDEASESIREFRNVVKAEIGKIQNYMKSLEAIHNSIESNITALEAEKQKRGLDLFEKNVERFMKGEKIDLQKVFTGVDFITHTECKAKADQIRRQVIAEVNKLSWLVDPQKALKDVLAEKQQGEPKIESPFSCDRVVQISDIDPQFKHYYEIYTHKLQHNPVHIKLDSEYSTKARMFETLMYHFKKCNSLTILSANINHFKSVLQFGRLRTLELVCNADVEAFVNLRADTVATYEAPNITSFSIKKLKEEDSKFLKILRGLLPNLRELNVEFVNKYDLGNNKELNDFFKGSDPKLQRFSLKFRGEAEVKKLYGNFTKFYKQSADNPLQDNLIRYLLRHQQITKLSLQGIRVSKVKELFQTVKQMMFLLDLKLILMETPETSNATVKLEVAKFNKRLLLNRKIMSLLKCMHKGKMLGRSKFHNTTDQIVELILG